MKTGSKKYFDIYLTFLKMGAVCFGGGYAMLPILERELVEKRQWTKRENLVDYYAIGQCTPGVIAVNTSTFVGNEVGGVVGGIVATLGFITPSLIIICLIASLLQNFAHIEMVEKAFSGIRVCVGVLIINATLKLWKSAVKDIFGVGIFIAVTVTSLFLKVNPVFFVIVSALLGIVYRSFREKE